MYLSELRINITEGVSFANQAQVLKLRDANSKIQIQIDNIHKQMKAVRAKPMPDPVSLARLRKQVNGLITKINTNKKQIKTLRGV